LPTLFFAHIRLEKIRQIRQKEDKTDKIYEDNLDSALSIEKVHNSELQKHLNFLVVENSPTATPGKNVGIDGIALTLKGEQAKNYIFKDSLDREFNVRRRCLIGFS